MSDPQPTQSLLSDPRLDRVAGWTLNMAAIVALGIGGWFFRGVQSSVERLNEAVGELRTSIAVLQVGASTIDELKRDLRGQDERLRSLEARLGPAGRK